MSDNKLCLNCTGTRHRATECRCTTTCQSCNRKHNSSICDKLSTQLMLAKGGGQVVYPVVVVEVDGIRCSALLDMGAGSSYTSAARISKLTAHQREYARIEKIMRWTSQKIEMYKLQVSNIKGVLTCPLC